MPGRLRGSFDAISWTSIAYFAYAPTRAHRAWQRVDRNHRHPSALVAVARHPPAVGASRPRSRPRSHAYLALHWRECCDPAYQDETAATDRHPRESDYHAKFATHPARGTKSVARGDRCAASGRCRWLRAGSSHGRIHRRGSSGNGRTCRTPARLPDVGRCGDAVEWPVAGNCSGIGRSAGYRLTSSGRRTGNRRRVARLSRRANRRSAVYCYPRAGAYDDTRNRVGDLALVRPLDTCRSLPWECAG